MKKSAINPVAHVRENDAASSPAFFRGEAPQLIVMLTHNDMTVENAEAVFESAADSDAIYWGFKEKPLPPEQMKTLFGRMRALGKVTVLEVVAYDEESGLEGAWMAAACGCDILMGTMFFPSIAEVCKANNIRYMPFVGKIEGRPSVLKGTLDGMVSEAKRALNGGAWGIDLLGYRYQGDAAELIREFVSRVDAPVCVAGSIDSHERLDEIKKARPWSFTIGSAFFENRFRGSFSEQINKVCNYITS